MQNPVAPKIASRAPTAIPILAPRVKPPVEGLKLEIGVADGVVIFAGVVEKREPLMEIVLPGVGCCWHAAVSAVRTVGRRISIVEFKDV